MFHAGNPNAASGNAQKEGGQERAKQEAKGIKTEKDGERQKG